MKRIDSRTVEFTTDAEMATYDRYQELLDEGKSIAVAAATAIEEAQRQGWHFDTPFVDYLSDETLYRLSSGMVILRQDSARDEGLTPFQRFWMIRHQRRGESFAEALESVR